MSRQHSVWALGIYLLVAGAWAQEENLTAHSVVEDTTRRVMTVVAQASEYVDEDPELYYNQVQDILDPVIDFRGFSRSVMGPYASSERYRGLDEAGRAQLRDQLDRFTQVMRLGLVRTYSKGLLAYGNSRIEVFDATDENPAPGRAMVRQLVFANQPDPYVLLYQMGQDKSGQWQLRNIIIENVNLGEIYRNQFEASARKHDGNLNAVIDNWTAVEVEA